MCSLVSPRRFLTAGLAMLATFALVFAWLHAQDATLPAGEPADSGAELKPGQTLTPLDLQWPRTFPTNGYDFALYQPSINEWPGNQLDGRFAIATRPTGTSNETYGVAFFTARTEIDKVERLVTLEDFKITKMDFPTEPGLQNLYEVILQAELPTTAKVIPLDHLEAVFAASADIEKVKVQQVENTPPKLIYTTQPSLLVQIDGPPILKPLVGEYERVVNTRAILLLSTNVFAQGYYLYASSNYFSSGSIEGPWVPDSSPPSDINTAVEAAMATKQVDPVYPRLPILVPPTIFVATTPTELLETKGVANMLSTPNTQLLYVSNSDKAIFYDLNDAN
jgi:hypothetical protein